MATKHSCQAIDAFSGNPADQAQGQQDDGGTESLTVNNDDPCTRAGILLKADNLHTTRQKRGRAFTLSPSSLHLHTGRYNTHMAVTNTYALSDCRIYLYVSKLACIPVGFECAGSFGVVSG